MYEAFQKNNCTLSGGSYADNHNGKYCAQEMKIRDFRIRQKRPWIAGFLDGIDTDGYDYVITSQEQADELRVSDDSKSILVACGRFIFPASQQEPSQSAIQQRSSYLMLLRKHWTSARVLRSASLV